MKLGLLTWFHAWSKCSVSIVISGFWRKERRTVLISDMGIPWRSKYDRTAAFKECHHSSTTTGNPGRYLLRIVMVLEGRMWMSSESLSALPSRTGRTSNISFDLVVEIGAEEMMFLMICSAAMALTWPSITKLWLFGRSSNIIMGHMFSWL